MKQELVNRGVLVLVVIGISALFLRMLLPFLQAIFLAALFAALFTPLYRKILERVGGRKPLAAGLTLISVLLFVGVPLIILFASVVSQALDVADTARPWVQNQLATPGAITGWLESMPFYDRIEPFRELAMSRIGELAGTLSGVLVNLLQTATVGTVSVLLSLLIMFYTMFFFLIDGDRLLYLVLYYLPLNDEDESKLLNRFLSVTRASLRGTAVIGVLQGALAGLALYLAGVPSALFWAVAMMFLSVVPGIGAALVWIPAVVWLMISGELVAAVLVAAFCGIVVGTLDNVLRPRLVGNDVQLHDLMIFFSTLGGLILFGFTGFIIGPIIAALFVTVWEIYGEEFREWLPLTAFKPEGGAHVPPRPATGQQTSAEYPNSDEPASRPDPNGPRHK